MIGKIYEGDNIAIIHNTITKTSNSGLFANKRLAVFSLKQAILGYQSKPPQEMDKLDTTCMNNCKETIHIKSLTNFTYYLTPQDKTILVLRWRQNEKGWQFKFQTQTISQQWYSYIYNALNPSVQTAFSKKKEIEQQYNKIDQKQIKTKSRFNQVQQQQKLQKDNNQTPPKMQTQKRDESVLKKKEGEQNSHSYRFKQYQKQNKQNSKVEDQGVPPTAIVTFKQRFPNNTIFGSIKRFRNFSSQQQFGQNWNVLWYTAIETQQQDKRLAIYNDFLRECQLTCKNIIKQQTIFKTNRKYVPDKVTINQEIYRHAGITFRLSIQKYIQSSENGLASVDYFKQYTKIMQNYSFILKTTKNKGFIKIPLACIFQYHGFVFYCEANIPSQFIQVDHSQKYIFQPQIQRLQSQLKIKINLVQINLFTNKMAAMQQGKRRNHYLIIKDINKVLPLDLSLGNSHSFCLSPYVFWQANDVYSKDYDFTGCKQKWIHDFLLKQNQNCSIISYQDLIETLQKNKLSHGMVPQIIPKCQNKYLHKIFATQLVSDVLCFAIRCEVMVLVKKWSKSMELMTKNQHPDYQAFIFKLLSSFLNQNISTNNKLWNIVYQQHYVRYSFNIKMQQIIIGYLLSSISFKLGVNFDFQLFILQKPHHFFNQQFVISQQVIQSFQSVFIKFANQDMCQSHQVMMQQIQAGEEEAFHQIQTFYHLKEEQNYIEPYHWKKICRLFSFFVPHTQEEHYSYLQIYSYLNMRFLDYPIFAIIVSAVKWLLFYKKVEEALQIVSFFNEISWFWVGESNPFIIQLYQILGQFYKSSNILLQSIKYFEKCNQCSSMMFKEGGEVQNLDRNYEIAKLLMKCNLHKDALSKYRQVKHMLKKIDKRPDDILDVMVQISKLYLHLGDIEHCFISCKATIQFSLLNPFKDELQEYKVYSLLLRSFQIKDQHHKYQFYVDIIQDKFKYSKNPIIVQNVLRLTIEQVLQKYNRYNLKKFGFIIFKFQQKKEQEECQSLFQAYKKVILATKKESPCKILRTCMQNSLDICDLMIERQIGQKSNRMQISEIQNILQLYCDFIGYQFILGCIITNLNNK